MSDRAELERLYKEYNIKNYGVTFPTFLIDLGKAGIPRVKVEGVSQLEARVLLLLKSYRQNPSK